MSRWALTGDWKATKSPAILEILRILDSHVRGQSNWIGNESIFVPLDLPNHVCLILCGAVVVYDTKAAEKRHMDCHILLGDGVHGRRDKRRLQGDSLCDGGIEVDR